MKSDEELVDDQDQLLSARAVSELTGGVSAATLHDWAARRNAGLPAPGPVHIQLSPRHRRWRLSDVRKWIRESEVNGRG